MSDHFDDDDDFDEEFFASIDKVVEQHRARQSVRVRISIGILRF